MGLMYAENNLFLCGAADAFRLYMCTHKNIQTIIEAHFNIAQNTVVI